MFTLFQMASSHAIAVIIWNDRLLFVPLGDILHLNRFISNGELFMNEVIIRFLTIPKYIDSACFETLHSLLGQYGLQVEAERKVADIVRPARQNNTLDPLFEGIIPENRHNVTDWGKLVGREMW
jgi:antitoxin component of MazEF toxin-antitoxin module